MTELTRSGPVIANDPSLMTWRRTTHRSALRAAPTRRALYANAREEARLVRGRNAFVWKGRVVPIGVPLAAGAGALVWRRRRSSRDAIAIAAAVAALSYLEARVEWMVRRNAYRRRRESD